MMISGLIKTKQINFFIFKPQYKLQKCGKLKNIQNVLDETGKLVALFCAACKGAVYQPSTSTSAYEHDRVCPEVAASEAERPVRELDATELLQLKKVKMEMLSHGLSFNSLDAPAFRHFADFFIKAGEKNVKTKTSLNLDKVISRSNRIVMSSFVKVAARYVERELARTMAEEGNSAGVCLVSDLTTKRDEFVVYILRFVDKSYVSTQKGLSDRKGMTAVKII